MTPVRIPGRPRVPLTLGIVVLLAVMALALPTRSLALRAPTPTPCLDQPFPGAETTPQLANALFGFGIIIVLLAAAIYIAIGAYMYFIAAGNAEMAKTGKDYIQRSIIGLILIIL